MKHFLIIISLFWSISLKGGIIPDANTAILAKILIQGITQVQKMKATYDKMVEFTSLSEQTKTEINDLLKLQNEVKTALLTAKNIKDLKISDILYFAKQNVQLKSSINDFVASTSSFSDIYQNIENSPFESKWGSLFYKIYHAPISNQSTSIASFADGLSDQSMDKNIFDQIGVDEYISDQKGRSYQMLLNFAGKYEEQAIELESLVKMDNLFSMNTSERMNLLIKAGSLMEKAVEMRVEANKLLQSEPGKALASEHQVLELLQYKRGFSDRQNKSQRYSEWNF